MQDIRPDWANLDIWVRVDSSAVPGLWSTHGTAQRFYNWYFDEWDLSAQDQTDTAPMHANTAENLQDFNWQPVTN